MKLAIQEDMLLGETLAEQFKNAERLGFEGIEFWSSGLEYRVEEIQRVASTSPVKPSTICYGRRRCLLHPEREEREAAIAEIKRYLQIAAELGAVGLVVVPIFGPPLIPDLASARSTLTQAVDEPEPAASACDLSPLADAIELEKRLLIELLRELGRHAESAGAVLILESLNRYETHLLRTLQDAVEVCQAVGSPYVQTMADLFHMSIEEADIPASIEKAGERVYHVHLADSNRKLPGLGHTDFAAALAALKEIGYDKYMALECGEPSQNTPLKSYYAQELSRSLDFLRKYL